MILGSISFPGASQAALDDQVGSQVDFLMVFECPGGVFWRRCGAFGRTWAHLGTTLGVTLAPEVGKKRLKRNTSGVQCIPETILRVKMDTPGHAE